ncbi:MAG: glycerol-3-phosphate 1-O-acyltransferase PlsY, partial [Bacteroidales bacterium]|nr:glycerol-3-phosphate 1-O-acyltransferase PlsY [Bacteroidales bacterium]
MTDLLMINILTIAIIVLAYLIGSFPTAVLVGKLFYHVDIRTKGSGNAGATNTVRVLGWKAGIPVMVFDVFKGWFVLQLPFLFNLGFFTSNQLIYFQIILGVAVVVGHILPVFAGFNGGKGVATLLGVTIALFPEASGLTALIFFLVLFLKGYVSLASIIASISFPIIEILILHHQDSLALIILSIMVGIFIPYTHRKNIIRLIKGEESKFLYK